MPRSRAGRRSVPAQGQRLLESAAPGRGRPARERDTPEVVQAAVRPRPCSPSARASAASASSSSASPAPVAPSRGDRREPSSSSARRVDARRRGRRGERQAWLERAAARRASRPGRTPACPRPQSAWRAPAGGASPLERQRPLQPVAPLAQVAAQVPERPRAPRPAAAPASASPLLDQPRPSAARRLSCSASSRSSHGAVGRGLRAARGSACSASARHQAAWRRADGAVLAAGRQPLQRELADRLQHPEARLAGPARSLRPQQALVDQRRDAVEDVEAEARPRAAADRLGRLQREAAGEDGQPAEERLLVGGRAGRGSRRWRRASSAAGRAGRAAPPVSSGRRSLQPGQQRRRRRGP